jgi:hypothetical protein
VGIFIKTIITERPDDHAHMPPAECRAEMARTHDGAVAAADRQAMYDGCEVIGIEAGAMTNESGLVALIATLKIKSGRE